MAVFIMKPTLGMPLPLAFLGPPIRWRSMIATALMAAALVIASIAVFGTASWQSFFSALPNSQKFLMQGLDHLTAHSITLGTILQSRHFSADIAQHAQLVWSIIILIIAARVSTSNARGSLKAATLAAATVTAAPYCMLYDLALLLPAGGFYVRDAHINGFRTGDRLILGLGAVVPYFAMEIQAATSIPIGFLTALIVFTLITSRALQSAAENQPGAERDEQKPSSVVPPERLFQNEH